ncbi:MAG TPA: hypothetical protein VJI98_05745 [Candidatus Nanoarchaeia archaeon]|nr:hypothetical protein [Candidatus Nanoarchaeia archaeon]
MANPQFVSEEPLTLSDVKKILTDIEKRDTELNYRSNKAKEYVENFPTLNHKKRQELHKKLEELALTRIKLEHIVKIIDFMPQSVEDLKTVLQAYPLSLPKKDQESILATVKAFL